MLVNLFTHHHIFLAGLGLDFSSTHPIPRESYALYEPNIKNFNDQNITVVSSSQHKNLLKQFYNFLKSLPTSINLKVLYKYQI